MRSPRKSPDSPAGFTLVEILVVVVILAIAAAVVVPHILDTGDFQAVAAARLVACDLQYAQNVAITSQVPVTVTFDVSGNSYTLSNASGPLIHPMSKTAYTADFDTAGGFEQFNVLSASFGGTAAVTFDELGTPSSPGTITLQAGPYMYVISVAAATGRVSVTTGS